MANPPKRREGPESRQNPTPPPEYSQPPDALARLWYKPFIAALRETGVIRDACEAAKIHRATAYQHKLDNPDFSKQWDEAIEDSADLLEREAVRRARIGVKEPVIHQGQMSGVWIDSEGERVAEGTPGARFVPLCITKYSDTLLIFLLKGMRPKKWRGDPETTPPFISKKPEPPKEQEKPPEPAVSSDASSPDIPADTTSEDVVAAILAIANDPANSANVRLAAWAKAAELKGMTEAAAVEKSTDKATISRLIIQEGPDEVPPPTEEPHAP